MAEDKLKSLTADDFKDRVGETFGATPSQEGEPFTLELRRVDLMNLDGETAAADYGRQRVPFSLEFNSGLPHHVQQQIVALEHDDLGGFDLFLVPLGPDADGHRYEAVFT